LTTPDIAEAELVPSTPSPAPAAQMNGPVDLRALFTASVHFGHPTKRWHPRMEPYIFSKRNGAHIIDLSKTLECLNAAKEFVYEVSGKGGDILLVGTKKPAQATIAEEATRVGSMYINQRWLGGMLTNFQTIQARIERLVYLEDAIAKGELPTTTKRETLRIEHEVVRLNKFFGGIKEMVRVPAAVFVVDVSKERIAVAEANRLGIPVIAIVDTNCDPQQIQYPIPGNDDGVRSIRLLTSEIATAIAVGREVALKAAQNRMAEEAELEAQEEAARAQAQAEAAARVAAPPPEVTSSEASAKSIETPAEIAVPPAEISVPKEQAPETPGTQ
jgi:small subunit ribosomal protein S2